MAFDLNNIFGIKKAMKYLLGQVSSLATQITNVSNSAGVDYYEHTAYYNVTGTTLTLVREVRNTLTEIDASAAVSAVRNSVGRYTIVFSDIGDVQNTSSAFVIGANSTSKTPTAFPQYTGGSGTQVVIEFKDNAGANEEVVGQFLLTFKAYK